ncbi:uncharacterized protein LOC144914261 isoform X2 [Branchiostoma floridae x Branchiostoma belcheri]
MCPCVYANDVFDKTNCAVRRCDSQARHRCHFLDYIYSYFSNQVHSCKSVCRINLYISSGRCLWAQNSMGEQLPGMLLSLLIILKVLGSTAASCSITKVTGSLTANCSDQGLTSVPQNLPTGVTHLHLQNNLITKLNQSDFSQYGNLTNLDLGNNDISEIQAGTFYPTPELRTLSLSHNKLTSLRSDMFAGLGILDSLYLDNNEIADIQAGTFNETSGLGTLHLQHNRITVLKADIFSKLSTISTVNISNNPWQCDCNMVPFRQKMKGSYLFEDQITCEGHRGQKLKDISPENLQSDCEKPTMLSKDQWNVPTAGNHGFIVGFISGNSDIFSPPVLVGIACAIFTLVIAMIVLTIWYKRRSRNIQESSDPRVFYNTANVTARAHNKTRHGALGADKEEYDYIDTLSQRSHTGTTLRGRLSRFEDEYDIIPPSLPPRNPTGPPAAVQNGSAALHGADAPWGVMDKDKCETDPQFNKYENGNVIAAAQDAETDVHVIMHEDDYLSFVVTEKYKPQPNKNSQMTAAAVASQQGMSHENDIESAENQTQAVCQNEPAAVLGAESHVQYWGEWYELGCRKL